MKPEITVDEDTAAPTMRVLKAGKTSSLLGHSTIGYAIGCNQAKAIMFKVTSSSGAGMFAKDWVSMSDISALLAKVPKITSLSVQELYAGKSANTAGFLLAVLQCEGLWESSAGDRRSYQCKDPKPFLNRVAALIDAGVALPDEDTAGKQLPDVSVPVPVAPKRGSLTLGLLVRRSLWERLCKSTSYKNPRNSTDPMPAGVSFSIRSSAYA